MKSRLTKEFRKKFKRLPTKVQKQAEAAYQLFEINPYYPSLHFKRIDTNESLYSARVGDHYRVVGVMQGDTIIWFFIGSHEEYNHLL